MHKAHKATPYEEAFARLSSVALQRKPRPLPEGREVTIQLGKLDDELRCPICRDVLKHTHVVMQCMHRFCRRCIERAVRASHCCPFCRESIPSRRSTRPDKAFDGLIGLLYPDLDVYEAEEERRLEDFSRSFSANAAAIATSVPSPMPSPFPDTPSSAGQLRKSSSAPEAASLPGASASRARTAPKRPRAGDGAAESAAKRPATVAKAAGSQKGQVPADQAAATAATAATAAAAERPRPSADSSSARPFAPFRIMPVALEGSRLAQVPGRLNRVKITLPTVTVATLEQHVLDRTCAALPAGLVKELFAGKRPIVCFFEPVEGGVLVSALPSLGARRIGEACGIQSRELESDIPTIGCRFCLASEVERLPRAATARMA